MLSVNKLSNNTYQQSAKRAFSSNLVRNFNKPAATSVIGVILAAFAFSSLLQGLDGENDNLSAANFRSIHAEQAENGRRILISCPVENPIALPDISNERLVDDVKTVLFPGAAIVTAAMSVGDCVGCVANTVPPPLPSFQHCVHSEAESMIDQKDNSCVDDNIEHNFLVLFGRYLTNNDFIE